MKFQRISDWSRRHPAAAGCLGLIFLVVVLLVGFDSYTRIRLYSEIRALERMGIPCDIEGFVERQRSSGASEALTREFQKLCEAISTDGFPPPDNTSSMMLLTLEDLPAFLTERAEELRVADRFLDEHPDLILWHDYSREFLWQVEFPVLNMIRPYVRLNHDRFYYALSKNDPAEAVRNFDRSAILRDYALQGRCLISYLVAIAVEAIRQQSLFDAAFYGELGQFDAATLRRWSDSMVEVESLFRFHSPGLWEEELGFIAETAQIPPFCLLIGQQEWLTALYRYFFGPVYRLDGAAAIRAFREMVLPLAAEDYSPATALKLMLYHDFLASRQKLTPVLAPVSCTFLPRVSDEFRRISALYTRCRVVRTGLAVELFLRKYGRLPEQLDELVPEFLPAVPGSPFTGMPLQIEVGTLDYYRPETKSVGKFEGYRVYADGGPALSPVGLTRTDRKMRLPVWNRPMKRNAP